MSVIKQIRLPEFGGADAILPVLAAAEYRRRLEAVVDRLQQEALNFLVVYGDREHFANLAFLTGFDPRFEEALLVINKSGERLLLVGNECMGYLPDDAIKAEKGNKYRALAPFEKLAGRPMGWAKGDKGRIASRMTKGDLAATDLGEFLRAAVACLPSVSRDQPAI